MVGLLVFIALLVIIFLFLRRRITLKTKIRKIIMKQTNTMRYLKNGTFKRHELMKSLKDKVLDELSGVKLSVGRKKLDKIIDKEISNVLNGWKGRLRVCLWVLASIVVLFIAAGILLPETTPTAQKVKSEAVTQPSKETTDQINALIISAESHSQKAEFALAKEELDRALKLDQSNKDAFKLMTQVDKNLAEQEKLKKEEEKKKKEEEAFNNGITLMNNKQDEKAIIQFERVSKNSERYAEAQKYINTIKREQFVNQCTNISYKELKKAPEKYRGKKIHFFGRIYNIQEISGKTIISLSTAQIDGDYQGDEAFLLYYHTTSLVEGDYIDIYGEVLGNYSKNQQSISRYLNGSQYTIYYDQSTFLDQAPVIKTRIIKDSNGKIYVE